MTDFITPDDLRRAVRMVVASAMDDDDVQRMVSIEVGRLDRWQHMAMACTLVARTVLLQIDEDHQDEGAMALWLHATIEQIIADLPPASEDDDDVL